MASKFERLMRLFEAQGMTAEQAERAARKKMIDDKLRHPDASTNTRGNKWRQT